MSESDSGILRVDGVSKRFPGVQALDQVDLDLRTGEVLGLVGENGSGKSTLLKVIAGHCVADDGRLVLDGDPMTSWNSPIALRRGVALVAQEVLIQPDLTVAENLMDGRVPRRRGVISWTGLRRAAGAELERLGLGIDPGRPAGSLALHQQQMLAIAKVVGRRPRVALFDEPTSSLTTEETAVVHAMIGDLTAAGSAVVYITHRLQEYFDLTDQVAVLRDGKNVTTRATRDLTERDLVELMVGRQQTELFQRPREKDTASFGTAPVALAVSSLRSKRLDGIDLTVRAGEIVGIAGQAGSGRTSLAETLFGRWSYTGAIQLDGSEVSLSSPRRAIDAGVALVPEDRKRAGLVLSMSVQENLAMASWRETGTRGIRRHGRDRAATAGVASRLKVRAANLDAHAGTLSGGNQQKISIGKWLLGAKPSVLILDEPTRGVDVGAKAEIYAIVEALAADGMAVVVISSELLEILRLAHRVVVMAGGRVAGELTGRDANEASITELAFMS